MKVRGKAELLNSLTPAVSEIVGEEVSREKVWEIFRACFGACVSLLSEEASLSLPGVASFRQTWSKRAREKPIRYRVELSSRIVDIGNDPSRSFQEEFLGKVPEKKIPRHPEVHLGIHDLDDLDDLPLHSENEH